MRKDTLFRTLIVADFALAIFTIAAEVAFGWTLPAPLREFVQRTWVDWSVRGVFLFAFYIGIIGATMISWVGLFLFWWPARAIYVAACIAWVVLIAASGPSVMTGVGAALHTAESLVGGLLVALMFFNREVSEKFDEAELEPAAA